jgi:hypothetical protein
VSCGGSGKTKSDLSGTTASGAAVSRIGLPQDAQTGPLVSGPTYAPCAPQVVQGKFGILDPPVRERTQPACSAAKLSAACEDSAAASAAVNDVTAAACATDVANGLPHDGHGFNVGVATQSGP